MQNDEKALALMQQPWGVRREKNWEERHKIGQGEEEKDMERRKEIMGIAGWKNKQEADMEDRGRSKRREI